jgi:hypothetical protein
MTRDGTCLRLVAAFAVALTLTRVPDDTTALVTAQAPTGRDVVLTPLALVGGTLIDGTVGPVVRNSVVLIRGERIEKVGTVDSLPVPAGYEPVSTEGMSVLPGLWDPHVHLVYAGYPNLAEWFKKYAAQIELCRRPVPAGRSRLRHAQHPGE